MSDIPDLQPGTTAPVPVGEPVAHVVRGGVVESVHTGLVVALGPAGATGPSAPVAVLGDPSTTVLARSALKPLQAVAMVRSGLGLTGPLLALASASHSGEPVHLGGVQQVLRGAGLTLADLGNTPDLPLGEAPRRAWEAAGYPPSSLAQNCSGKHAAMLATCVAAGWPTKGYLFPDHPLQQAVLAAVTGLTGDVVEHVTVDGCGAPLLSCTLGGLARAFSRIASATGGPEALVADALRQHPEMVSGTAREALLLARAVPGLMVKDGAEGFMAAAMPDGRAAVVKVLDGSERARPGVSVAALRAAGIDGPGLDTLADLPVLGGGRRVGEVRALPPRRLVPA